MFVFKNIIKNLEEITYLLPVQPGNKTTLQSFLYHLIQPIRFVNVACYPLFLLLLIGK